jgi:hypothetical protein
MVCKYRHVCNKGLHEGENQIVHNKRKNLMNTQIFETGAKTQEVNNLILFADNTEKLAKIRDEIYMQAINPTDNDILKSHLSGFFGNGECPGYAGTISKRVERILSMRFNRLFYEALGAYKREFPNDYYEESKNVPYERRNEKNVLSYAQRIEFCELYAADFENWKKEHGY